MRSSLEDVGDQVRVLRVRRGLDPCPRRGYDQKSGCSSETRSELEAYSLARLLGASYPCTWVESRPAVNEQIDRYEMPRTLVRKLAKLENPLVAMQLSADESGYYIDGGG